MTEKIIICDHCKGFGKIGQSELIDYHHGYYDEWDIPCGFCNGSGRVMEEITNRKLTKEELKLRKRT